MMIRAVCDNRMDQAIPFADSGHRRTSRHMLSFLACSSGQIPASVQTPQLKNQPRTIFKYVSPHLFIYPHYFDHIYAGFFPPLMDFMVHGQCYHLVVHGRRTAEYITCNNFLDPCHAVIITVLWSVSYLMTGADGLFVPRTIPFVFRTSYTCIMEIASHSHFSYYYKSGVIHSGYSGASDTR